MRRNIAFSLTLILFVTPSLISAQSEAQQTETEQPNIAMLLEDVNEIASNLENSIAGLHEAIQNSAKSKEEGAALLQQMQASVEAVHGSLSEDSEIWSELTKAMEIWDQNRQDALAKSETNPAFDPIAEEWGVKIDQAGELRKQILNQRAESTALLDSLMSDREVVLAYYDLGQADRALQAMTQVSDELGRMNDSMQSIVDQTAIVAGPTISE